ncbi:MAG: DMT family transporter [Mucilaginibacter polytrichastri]|nr:DMT family transporter [Mucilaginibacter polytrichastri]
MKRAFIVLHLAVLLAGFTGLFGKLIALNAGLISWYRLILSFAVLLVIFLFRGKLPSAGRGNIPAIGLSGALIGFHWIFFYASIQQSNVAVGVVCFAMTSFFTALLEPLIRRRRLSFTELGLSSLTLAGIALIFGLDAGYRNGIILGVISSMFAALYAITNERLAKKHDGLTIMFYAMGCGALALTAIMLVYIPVLHISKIIPSWMDVAYLFVLASLCTVLLYYLVTQSLKTLSAFSVNIAFNLEPIYSIIIAILLFKENKVLSPAFYLGLSLVMLSVILQMYITTNSGRKPSAGADPLHVPAQP